MKIAQMSVPQVVVAAGTIHCTERGHLQRQIPRESVTEILKVYLKELLIQDNDFGFE